MKKTNIELILWTIILTSLSFTSAYAQRAGFAAVSPESPENPTKIKCKAGEQWYVVEIAATEFNFDVNSPESAQSVIEEILRRAGYLPKVIMAKPAQVANAAACHSIGVNYILYNPNYFKKIYKNVEEIWADRAIFAHELGHFHHNHYMRGLGSTPPLELEADEFAGEVLAKMGATIQQAKAAFASPEMRSEGGHSHPATTDRLVAVEKGWRKVYSNPNVEQVNRTIISQQARSFFDSGIVYIQKKEYDKAIVDFTKAIEISPRYALAYANRGTAYSYKSYKDKEKAIADYTKAIEIDPTYAAIYNNRGSVYYIRRKYDTAITDYSKAIEIDPKYALAYVNRARAYYFKKEYDKAIADYTKIIEINPKSAAAYYDRGNLFYFQKKFYDKAIADYTKAIEINPNNALVYFMRAGAYRALGRHDLADADNKRASALRK